MSKSTVAPPPSAHTRVPGFFRTLSVALLAVQLAACAGSLLTADGQQLSLRSEEFAAWAQSVFRMQNDLLDELAFALDEQPDSMPLIAAEDRLLAACAGINDLAVRARDGEGRRAMRDLRAARQIPDCERAALQARSVLDSVQ